MKYTIEYIQFISNMGYVVSIEDDHRAFVGKITKVADLYFYAEEVTGSPYIHHSCGFYLNNIERISCKETDELLDKSLFKLISGGRI